MASSDLSEFPMPSTGDTVRIKSDGTPEGTEICAVDSIGRETTLSGVISCTITIDVDSREATASLVFRATVEAVAKVA